MSNSTPVLAALLTPKTVICETKPIPRFALSLQRPDGNLRNEANSTAGTVTPAPQRQLAKRSQYLTLTARPSLRNESNVKL